VYWSCHANGFPSETYKDLLSNIEGDIQSPISILGKNINSVEEGYSDFIDEVIEHASVTQGEEPLDIPLEQHYLY
jgi:hypothetical protein